MSQLVVESPAFTRLCPAPGHGPRLPRSCGVAHCMELDAGLLIQRWTPQRLITRADVLASYDAVRELSGGDLLPMVIHLRGLTGIAVDARDAILDCSLSARIALIGVGPVDQVITAFTEAALCETRYFECAEAAEGWARAVGYED